MVKEIRQILKAESLTSSEKVVLIYLQICAGDKGMCYPSVRKIAQDVNLSERYVWTILRSLQLKGCIEISTSPNKKTNIYKLKLESCGVAKIGEFVIKQAIQEASKRYGEYYEN